MNTLEEMFAGRMGRVVLTRVAIRVRKPEILKMSVSAPLEVALIEELERARREVSGG